jgi:hypothetical protein
VNTFENVWSGRRFPRYRDLHLWFLCSQEGNKNKNVMWIL